ncbi:acyltransferase domain-containing protein [Nocardia arthritidis]|uniref:Acyltransferase domain-containing protein n=1 Tax=Nocardia arthritidis TaxID=228602 RepID=A0A6G9YMW8_9NOCA|nr:acyltransferase domain-containing protein [Nocardia arthritidis]QIS14554.1 acyltransferase domain-containing protein [Nocardia arthritidis]
MNNRIAILFPGQGAWFAGALAEARSFPEAVEVLAEIDAAAIDLLGHRITDRLTAADSPDLDKLLAADPDLLQLAIYATSVVTYRILAARGLTPAVLMGHSFGEIAALVAAGAFSAGDGARIVFHRNAALREAGIPDGAMAALGTDTVQAERLLALLGDPETVIAVANRPDQTVISGHRSTVEAACAIAAVLGVGARTLPSPYPFHSPLLTLAAKDFHSRIQDLPQRSLEYLVHSPITGRAYVDSDRLAAELAEHFTRRVNFADAVRAVPADIVIECGAGDTLTKIMRHLAPGAELNTATLLPTAPITTVISTLTSAGVLVPAGAGELRRLFAPELDATDFDRLWRLHGARITELVRAELAVASSAVPSAGSAAVPAASAKPVSIPAPAAPAADDGSRAQVLDWLVNFYADALEYPAEVFEEDTDLEAELGVDSVKQTELLTRVGEQRGLPPRPSNFAVGEHNTLGRIADLIIAA